VSQTNRFGGNWDPTSRSSLIPMALHNYVCVEVIEGTITLGTARPRTMIETLYLVVASTGALSYCIPRKRHK
jgi:hypothetical protein